MPIWASLGYVLSFLVSQAKPICFTAILSLFNYQTNNYASDKASNVYCGCTLINWKSKVWQLRDHHCTRECRHVHQSQQYLMCAEEHLLPFSKTNINIKGHRKCYIINIVLTSRLSFSIIFMTILRH